MNKLFITLLITLLFVGCGREPDSTIFESPAIKSNSIFVAIGKTPAASNPDAFRLYASSKDQIQANSVRFCLSPLAQCKAAGAVFVETDKEADTGNGIYATKSPIILRADLTLTVFAVQNGLELTQSVLINPLSSIAPTPITPTTPVVVQDQLVPNPENYDLTDTERGVMRLVNQERKNRGLKILIVQPKIMNTSRQQSKIMKQRGRMQHGFTSGWGRENIAMGQRTPASVMNSWMNSSGHKRNILSNVTYIGVGDTAGQSGSIYWTQQFN